MALLDPEILTKKIGPLPVWVYLATGGGLLWLYGRRKGTANDGSNMTLPYQPIPSPQTGMSFGTPQSGSGSVSGGSGGGGSTVGYDPNQLQQANQQQQQPATKQPPQQAPAPVASYSQPTYSSLPVDNPNPQSLQPVFGGTSLGDISVYPSTSVAGSVQAPPGGSFMYGEWQGNQLVSATYSTPTGPVSVGA